MLEILFRGKKKVKIRAQIVNMIIDDLVKRESNGTFDDCGKTWSKRSFDEIIEHFSESIPDLEFNTASKNMEKWVVDINNPTYCDTYNVLHNIYFGKCATEFEKDKLRFEFKGELRNKGLKEVFEKHSAVKWKYYEKKL